MIDKAIILAAGQGKRMGTNTPKPLLPLDRDGTTFLDWHLRALARQHVKDVWIVGSPKTCGSRLAANVHWVMNDHPGSESGSGHSTALAFDRGVLDGKSRVVLMDADIVYDPTLFDELAEQRGPSKTLVCGRHRDTAEEVLVFGDDRPRVHGKGLVDSPLVAGMSCFGEATGILLLEPQDHALWQSAATWCMHDATSKTRSEHEDITQRLMLAGRLEAVVFEDDRRFMECDTKEEYEAAKNEMVPRWRP